MNADRLLAHYERITHAPDAVACLRRFILDLAVRGKLVPQDPKDEPASELLKRIEKEKARLVKDGDIKVRKPLSIEGPEKLRPELPFNWKWITFGETINSHLGGGTPSKNNAAYWDGDICWASVKDVGKSKYLDTTIDRITEAGLADSSSNLIPPGSLIVVTRMGLGKVSINLVPIAINQDLRALSLSSLMAIDYCYIFLKTHGFEGTGLTVKGIKTEQLLCIPFPLPPLAEQHRIVAKVDELMALCDRLEAARAEREATRDRLAVASLARLNTPDPDTFQDDVRFALDALPALTTRPDQIKQLRQTVLNLAVRGKLVTQDPNDQPASELLKRIQEKRSQWLKSGYPNPDEARTQIKKLGGQIIPDGLARLPIGWSWATLLQCSALVVDCKNKTAPYASQGIRLIRTTNVRDGRLNLVDQKYVNQKTSEIWSARCTPEPGDILITREAPMGEVCLIPPGEKICLGQRMMLARLVPDTIDRNFMICSLRDPNLMDRVQDKPIGATVQHLRVGGVETLLVPLPPFAEQGRIVAKVDELMALCDRLVASLTTGEDTRRRLLDALFAEALAPADGVIPRESVRVAAHG